MKDKIILWFGDSYTVGSELAYFYGQFDLEKHANKIFDLNTVRVERQRPDLAFPTIVSEQLGIDYLILGHGGASIQKSQFILINFIKQKFDKDKKYVAIFALPTQYSRCFYLDSDGKAFSETNDDILAHQLKFGKYEITMTINSIYSICKMNNIEPYFVALWSKIELMDQHSIVPEENWLLPRSKTLVEVSWNFSDPPESWRELFKIKPLERLNDNKALQYVSHLLNVTILSKSNETFKKYVFPCANHPNKEGHIKLSETLLELLKEKSQLVINP
jgi:hypothetical protein